MSPISRRLLAFARLWALIVIGLHLIAPLLEEHWAWGVWPATLLPTFWRWLLAIVAAALVLAGDRLGRALAPLALAPRLQRVLSLAAGTRRGRLLIAAAAAIPFYLLRIRHLQWGDAELIVKALADPYRITYVWQAPFDIFIHARLWQAANRLWGWPDPIPVYHILSTLAGIAFVYLLLSLARLLGRSRTERFLLAGLVVTLGTMQLFFGYIENYPIMTTGILLYAYLGARTLRGELPLIFPASALALTHAFHPSTLILAPSLLYLWSQSGNLQPAHGVIEGDDGAPAGGTGERARARPPLSPVDSQPLRRPARLSGLWAIVVPYALVFAAVVALMEGGQHGLKALATVDFPGGGDRQWFVPLFEVTTEWQHYTMFSLGHLVDIVNQQLLVAPVVWPMLAGSAVLARGRLPVADRTARFLLIMALGHLLLILIWNADYGGQKDWDLFSPAAVSAALALAYILPRVLPERRSLQAAAWALVATQGLHTVMWVLSNAQPR